MENKNNEQPQLRIAVRNVEICYLHHYHHHHHGTTTIPSSPSPSLCSPSCTIIIPYLDFGWSVFYSMLSTHECAIPSSWVEDYLISIIPGAPPPPKEQSIQSIFQDFALINSYLFSPCWIEHLFLIIITPRSSNLVENI